MGGLSVVLGAGAPSLFLTPHQTIFYLPLSCGSFPLLPRGSGPLMVLAQDPPPGTGTGCHTSPRAEGLFSLTRNEATLGLFLGPGNDRICWLSPRDLRLFLL